MAQKGFETEQRTFFCFICLRCPDNPVVIPCGHSYCTDCIKAHRDCYSCPQCGQTFSTRPDLPTSTDVLCDICMDLKLKATTFCLVCLISFCEKHIQPHVESPAYKKHKLVQASRSLQENICSDHNELMKLFCRSDQQLICYLCSVEEHKGHITVSAAAEVTEKKKGVDTSRQNLQERIQVREGELKALREETEAVNAAADKTAKDSEEILTRLISEVKQKIRSEQEAHLIQLKELQEKLDQEISELKSRDAELKILSQTEDDGRFLRDYASLPGLGQATAVRRPPRGFEAVTAAVSEFRDKLQEALKRERTNVSLTQVEVPLSEPEPGTREDFLKHFDQITLDPNTINKWLFLSEDYRSATLIRQAESYPLHPDRFSDWHQVLSTKILTGCCYWEVEMTGAGICVAVSYKDIRRAWRSCESGFGLNDKSWTLNCYNGIYDFWHDNVRTPVSGPRSSRVGVFLDYSAGVLSFYSVSESTMTLLHRTQTTFTQPLY
uniref:Tripartite motif containing 16 n=1 Tax=Tetraodon nigroviridis TaxID=99883 RepID=H3DCJ3_TETNG